jgi:hypothetical protein
MNKWNQYAQCNANRKQLPRSSHLEELDRRSRQCNASRSQRSAYFQVRGVHSASHETAVKEEAARSFRTRINNISDFRIDPPPLHTHRDITILSGELIDGNVELFLRSNPFDNP